MPCNSDYLNQNSREQELQHAAKLYVWALTKIGVTVPDWADEAAGTYYCSDDRALLGLCHLMRTLPDTMREGLLYGYPREKIGRELADWWEEHQKADAARRAAEGKQKLLIILSNGSDVMIKMVPYEALKWINSPYPNDGEGGHETMPTNVAADAEDDAKNETIEVNVTRGSGDNDRALQIPGREFDSVVQAFIYAREHGLEIVDEYHGMIY